MKKKRQRVPAPYNKWITLKAWKNIAPKDRKIITDLIKLQKRLRKYYKNYKPEPYVNMNAEIEYLKSIGQH